MEVCLYLFFLVEYFRIRYSFLDSYLNRFTKKCEMNRTFLLCHFDLLLGCAFPIWISVYRNDIQDAVLLSGGIVGIGIGDSMSGLIGKRYGTYRFGHNQKSV